MISKLAFSSLDLSSRSTTSSIVAWPDGRPHTWFNSLREKKCGDTPTGWGKQPTTTPISVVVKSWKRQKRKTLDDWSQYCQNKAVLDLHKFNKHFFLIWLVHDLCVYVPYVLTYQHCQGPGFGLLEALQILRALGAAPLVACRIPSLARRHLRLLRPDHPHQQTLHPGLPPGWMQVLSPQSSVQHKGQKVCMER